MGLLHSSRFHLTILFIARCLARPHEFDLRREKRRPAMKAAAASRMTQVLFATFVNAGGEPGDCTRTDRRPTRRWSWRPRVARRSRRARRAREAIRPVRCGLAGCYPVYRREQVGQAAAVISHGHHLLVVVGSCGERCAGPSLRRCAPRTRAARSSQLTAMIVGFLRCTAANSFSGRPRLLASNWRGACASQSDNKASE
jgi:hypothetical protein